MPISKRDLVTTLFVIIVLLSATIGWAVMKMIKSRRQAAAGQDPLHAAEQAACSGTIASTPAYNPSACVCSRVVDPPPAYQSHQLDKRIDVEPVN
ncbi:hypothetical protein BC940DRAFT_330155 [Gongronella butleri]|nr:hypothetical protein BC940DRAFT_330155 [Gongronella butleri]